MEQELIVTEQDWVASSIGLNYVLWLNGRAELLMNEIRAIELNSVLGFRVEYCRDLFNHLRKGKSYESFGYSVGLLPASKKRFESEIVEWRVAKEFGIMAGMDKLEELGLNLASGESVGNAATWKLIMQSKYKDLWGEHKTVENKHSGVVKVHNKLEIVQSIAPIGGDISEAEVIE